MATEATSDAEIVRLIEGMRPKDEGVEIALKALSDGPTQFEKCAGWFGIGEKSLLSFLVRNHTEEVIEPLCDAMEAFGQMQWTWNGEDE